jgi:hypothetical protein
MNKQTIELLDKAIDSEVVNENPQLLDDDIADAVEVFENREIAIKTIIRYLLDLK